jgi:hypothetical protein
VAKATCRSKIDPSDAYEQVCVEPEGVWKTAFMTILGTMFSHVMQIEDCNASATFQCLMMHIFCHQLGKYVHVYLDDVFVFPKTLEDHEHHLQTVIENLKGASLFLSRKKCSLYAGSIDCLRHITDAHRIHVTVDKMDKSVIGTRLMAWS